MATFEDAIETAIEKEIQTLGKDIAVKRARSVEGLEIDDDGKVTALERDGSDVLGDLVLEYVDYAGTISASMIARQIQGTEMEDLDLPRILRSRMD